jgi:hypothetical protein
MHYIVRWSSVVLLHLDLLAAIDVIDHCILLDRTWYSVWITGGALKWTNFHLEWQHQSVSTNSVKSTKFFFFSFFFFLAFAKGLLSGLNSTAWFQNWSEPSVDNTERHDMIKISPWSKATRTEYRLRFCSFSPTMSGKLSCRMSSAWTGYILPLNAGSILLTFQNACLTSTSMT